MAAVRATPTPWVNAKAYGAKGDGTTDDTAALLAATASVGNAGTVLIPEGTYLVTGPIMSLGTDTSGVTITGEGRNTTMLKLGGNLASPLFSATGDSISDHAEFITIRDLGVWGTANDYTGTVFSFTRCDRVTLQRVSVNRVAGTCVYGKELWDSAIIDCQFVACGHVANTDPTLELVPYDAATNGTGCNNVHFFGCQFEENAYINVRLGEHSRKCQFVACKFHGKSSPAAYDHLVLYGAYLNFVMGCNFTKSGSDHISVEDTGSIFKGANSIVGNMFDSAAAYAIRIHSSRNAIDGNVFGRDSANTSGSLLVEAGSGNNTWGPSNVTAEAVTDNVSDGSGLISVARGNLGFYGATPIQKPEVTGSRGSNAALASLCTALANLGLITDSTS